MAYNRIVGDIIREYGTRNPFRIAEAMDAIILIVPLKGVNGFYQLNEAPKMVLRSTIKCDIKYCRKAIGESRKGETWKKWE